MANNLDRQRWRYGLFERARQRGALIVDEDGLYDPRLINDHLFLVMKAR